MNDFEDLIDRNSEQMYDTNDYWSGSRVNALRTWSNYDLKHLINHVEKEIERRGYDG